MAQVQEQAAGTPAWVWREGWPEMPLFFTFFSVACGHRFLGTTSRFQEVWSQRSLEGFKGACVTENGSSFPNLLLLNLLTQRPHLLLLLSTWFSLTYSTSSRSAACQLLHQHRDTAQAWWAQCLPPRNRPWRRPLHFNCILNFASFSTDQVFRILPGIPTPTFCK